MRQLILGLFIFFTLTFSFSPVSAQETSPERPVYVVQEGDSLFSIAIKFGVTVDDLIKANELANPDLLSSGMELVIPGLEGVRGRLVTETITLGQTLRTLSIRHQIAPEQIMRLNRITSPMEVFAGASLVIPQVDNAVLFEGRAVLEPGISLFQLSVSENANPWLVTQTNLISQPWQILPGELIFSAAGSSAAVNLVSPLIQNLQVSPLPLVQGFATSISVSAAQPIELNGSLAGYPLRFFTNENGVQIALQGIHAMSDPGIYPITLEGRLADGKTFSFEQMVVLQAAGYSREDINGVDPQTIDPTVTEPENLIIEAMVANASPEKLWDGFFISPGYDPEWITSWFGTRRAYNGGPYAFFHTGIDYGGGTGTTIKAPAPGIVIFAGPLTVRGNATVIDHGWGVYSGFWHQSEIQVQVGERVGAGQIIGLVGGTGRITGPHLHWEIWVNGVQVNPLLWLSQSYP
jgi:murein DD-endopeptidase MepM/ murein hydrolase activator NlpD